MSRLVFINRFYWPDEPATSQLLTDLAEGLAGRGHAVQVVTSRPAAKPKTEVRRGVHILRIAGSRLGRKGRIGRLCDLATFTLGALWTVLRRTHRGDTCIFLTDPPLLAALCWPWLALRRIAMLHWIQDIYPEIAVELTSHGWLRLLRPWRNFVWQHSHACITLGQDMAHTVAAGGVASARIHVVPNWAPAGVKPVSANEVASLKNEWGLSGKFVLLYSGNLGRVHQMTPLLAAATALRSETHLAFVFVGHGAQLATLQRQAAALKLDNVRFFPAQPRERLSAVLSVADAHFVTLRPGCEGYVLPSKLYGITAVGRPVIFIGPTDSDMAHQISNTGCGRAFAPDDSNGLSQFLSTLSRDAKALNQFSEASLAFSKTHALDQAVERWESILPIRQTLAGVSPKDQSPN